MKYFFITTLNVFLSVSFIFAQTPTKEDLTKTNIEMVKLFNAQKYDEALPIAQKAVQMSEQIFGKEHLETGKALRNLGYVYFNQNNNQEAEKTFERALSIYEKIANSDKETGISLVQMIESLALIKYQKKFETAEDLYKSALSLREKFNGQNSTETLTALNALGNINYWRKDYKKAGVFWKRALETASINGDTLASKQVMIARYTCALRKSDNKKELEAFNKKLQENTPKPKEVKFINGGVINGKARNLVKPAYPVEAKQARAQGNVEVDVLINEKGEVVSACAISSPHPALADSTEIAAYQSSFSPTTLEGKPVKVSGRIIYRFIPQ